MLDHVLVYNVVVKAPDYRELRVIGRFQAAGSSERVFEIANEWVKAIFPSLDPHDCEITVKAQRINDEVVKVFV